MAASSYEIAIAPSIGKDRFKKLVYFVLQGAERRRALGGSREHSHDNVGYDKKKNGYNPKTGNERLTSRQESPNSRVGDSRKRTPIRSESPSNSDARCGDDGEEHLERSPHP